MRQFNFEEILVALHSLWDMRGEKGTNLPVPDPTFSLFALNSTIDLSVIIKKDSSITLFADCANRLNIDPVRETCVAEIGINVREAKYARTETMQYRDPLPP